MSEERYAQWSILELLGHRRLAGFVTEQEIAGKGFLRIDIPGPGETKVTQFYSPDSVYGLTPTTEEVARRTAAISKPEPVGAWELPANTPRWGEPQIGPTVDVEDADDEDLPL